MMCPYQTCSRGIPTLLNMDSSRPFACCMCSQGQRSIARHKLLAKAVLEVQVKLTNRQQNHYPRPDWGYLPPLCKGLQQTFSLLYRMCIWVRLRGRQYSMLLIVSLLIFPDIGIRVMNSLFGR